MTDFEVLFHPLESFRSNPKTQEPGGGGGGALRVSGALDMAAATAPAESRLSPFDRELQEISRRPANYKLL